MFKGGYVYIVTNKNKTTLYIGVTSNIVGRIYDIKTINTNIVSLINTMQNTLFIMKYLIALKLQVSEKKK